MMVYLAADQPLDFVAWDDDHPAFWVGEPSADEERVRSQFSKPYVVFVGAHEGCSCGFQYARWPSDSLEPDELARCQQSLKEFADYLDGQVASLGEIDLYACWDGDQEATPEHQRNLSPADFRRRDFVLFEKELSRIRVS